MKPGTALIILNVLRLPMFVPLKPEFFVAFDLRFADFIKVIEQKRGDTAGGGLA
jgi:hypothetical protein